MRKYLAIWLIVLVLIAVISPAFCLDSEVSGGSAEGDSEGQPSYTEAPPMYTAPESLEDDYKQYNIPERAGAPKVQNRDNGIVVGQPKLFELRSLQLMIDNVKASLAQTAYPDVTQLFGMTGRIQGVQSNSSNQSIEVGATPGSSASISSSAPQASSLHSNPNSTSEFESRSSLALSPTDVLAEQTSLWHQLMNLQMLLDGALSDRLIPVDGNGAATVPGKASKYAPRAQAIVGFQITVDPRQDCRDAVAEATITIDNKDSWISDLGGYGDEPSLMMLLPRNKTYNTVSINRDNKSFGFGTVVNVLSFGSALDKRRETYYIGKDTDTVALEKIPGLPAYGLEKILAGSQASKYRGVSFGWQFRPVFNRASVEPGVRQVFAMISLPASVAEEKWVGKVRVMTYWRKYDRATGAVGKPIEGTLNEWVLDDIVVPIGSGVEEALEPYISKAQWEDAGAGNVAVTIEGSNFSLGTDIACGETVLGEKNLSLLSAKRVRLVVPAANVARGDVTLIGRYGVAKLRKSAGDNDDPYKGIEVSAPRFTQQDDQTTNVELTLLKVQNAARLLTDRRPVVQLDGQLFGVGEKPFTSISVNETEGTISIKFPVPTQTLGKSREFIVRDLVGPAAIMAGQGAGEGSCVAHKAVVLSTGDEVSVAVLGSGFREDVKVLAGGREVKNLKLNSTDGQATVLTFEIGKETAANTRYILITQGKQPPMLVPFSMPAPSGSQAQGPPGDRD